MSSTRESIIESFRDLVQDVPYYKISVSDICKKADVSRNTFYRYFEEKESIIAAIFDEKVVMQTRMFNKMFSLGMARENTVNLQQGFYEAVYEDREFYSSLLSPLRVRNVDFRRAVTDVLTDLDNDVLETLNFKGEDWERDYISAFYASSQAHILEKWILEGMTVPPKDLAALYSRLANGFWEEQFGSAE